MKQKTKNINTKKILKIKMKWMKFLILGLFILSFVPFTNALDSLGDDFIQGQCINISQSCSSCSYVNISSISNKENANLINNVEMQSIGNGEWRYEFCNTYDIGRYDVKGQGDIDGIDQSFSTYFIVKGGNIGFFIIIFILLYGLTFYGIKIDNPWVSLIGCFGLTIFGIYTSFNGIDIYKNSMTDVISYVNLAIGLGIGFESLRNILDL